ncbi:ATP-grasp ribosomal peptide maturase [Streptomyces virens]|uniref:ATP-grasp ribosomal peptide maturase n=1 Tax=Streptomyces virens TaxID=285572 RepID=A0ABP6P2R4_9ACTN|nr:ATP-grasp ribosomal peptide maturase [Streptomyces calvus]MBA8973936.1 ATP-grasp ribosomal peptide maturase [Streptomyces calvus]MYS31765.1 ATP-grasp ribosomal peptide maturase [Streptomyces sp. SID7804]
MASTVLVVTALEDVTADLVVAALNAREVPVVRVDPADIGPALTFGFRIDADRPAWSGRLRTASREVEPGEVAAVYYRRPTPYGTRFAHLPRQQADFAASEARHGLGGVLNALSGARYVNHPAAVARAESKPAQLRRLARLGLRIPPTLITNERKTAREFAAVHGPVVCKTFRGLPAADDGQAGAIWTQRVDPETFDDTLTVTAHLFQAEIPKTGDVRVTVVGRRVFARQIAAPDGALDWRRGDWGALLHAPITVPPPVEAALHSYLASFGLVFGCFDFALTGDGDDPQHWTAIECNPNGQWGWLPDAYDITEAFADLLTVERKGRS